MVYDALVRGLIQRSRTDGKVKVESELPVEVSEWLDREARRLGVTVTELIHHLTIAEDWFDLNPDRQRSQLAQRAWRATEEQ